MTKMIDNITANVFLWMIIILNLSGHCLTAKANEHPMIFPLPQSMEVSEGYFELNEKTLILVPQKASDSDLFLAHFLIAELGDKYGLAMKTQFTSKLPSDKQFILIGSINNPLVKRYCKRENIKISLTQPGPEGYVLRIEKNGVLVAGSDERGALYGLQSLRQLIQKENGVRVQCVYVRDWPATPFRGIRLYIPGRENIPFFKRFLRDFMVLYKFNKVILEVNACMRLDQHPELNAGWIEFAKNLNYSRRSRPDGPNKQYQNSAHHDAGDGGILEKDEVKDLVRFANAHYVEVIPEIPSLTHSYYLLSRHRELAEVQQAEWPDTYCPSNPQSYKLLFDVMDEYIEVMKPKMIHIGHDEWRMPINVCQRCKGKDYTNLFVEDVNKIYDYLIKKEIKVAMWGDHLLESVRSKGYRDRVTSTGYRYKMPGALAPEQVKVSIPKDILIFNWFWGDEKNDLTLEGFGFKQVYGNFRTNISNWGTRSRWPSVLGGAPSSWAATTEMNIGKDLIYDFLGCANLLWSTHQIDQKELSETVHSLIPVVRNKLSGKEDPSEERYTIVPVNITSYFNASSGPDMLGADLSNLVIGKVGQGRKLFDVKESELRGGKCAVVARVGDLEENPTLREVNGIQINEDVSSLMFLHSCAKQAENEKAYRMIYNFDDTADLLGWYEIVYEDEYVETIPIRYGVNILEWNVRSRYPFDGWAEGRTGSPQNIYCYEADAIDCSVEMQKNPITFFALEWRNERFGKKIKEINLKSTKGYTNYKQEEIDSNAIILIALTMVK